MTNVVYNALRSVYRAMERKQEASGLSRVELLAVLTILGVVAALLVPAVLRARDSTRMRDCRNNLRRLGELIYEYRAKYGGFPPAPGKTFLNTLRNTPTTSSSVAANQHDLFVCPCTGREPSVTVLDYRYCIVSYAGELAGADERGGPALGSLPLACDMDRNHPRPNINVLVLDGSVRCIGLQPGDQFWHEDLKKQCDSPDVFVQSPPQDGQ
jgi:type II secretory pathway pseudopilin PulG